MLMKKPAADEPETGQRSRREWRRAGRRSSPVDAGEYANSRWELSAVLDNLTFAGERIIAWYVAPPQMWSFRAHGDGEAFIEDQAAQLAELVGTVGS